jgi:hypothetical protein
VSGARLFGPLVVFVCATLAGYLLGGAEESEPSASSQPGAVPAAQDAKSSEPRPSLAAQIAADVVELPWPRTEEENLVAWTGLAAEIEKAFARRGLALELADERGSLAKLKDAGDPVDVAALLDLRAAVEHAADHGTARDGCTRLARALDPDPTRDSIRAPLLANDSEAVRLVAADLDAGQLPLRTATLLGLALLRGGDVEDALEAWRSASLQRPDDLALHLLLGWRLLAAEPPEPQEARRHLEAAHALRPASAGIRARLAAASG